MGVLAVIPARGGSKGLPRKNVLPLCGKPLIAWTIEAALHAKQVGRVVVSTDDAEIGAISRRYGAEVVWRPQELGGDDSPSEASVLHVVQKLNETDRPIICLLQCTSPLMLPEDIDGTVSMLADADSAFTAVPWQRFVWERNTDGLTPVGHDKARRPMRQELGGQLLEVGAVYAMKTAGFLQTRNRFFGRTAAYPVSAELAIEIDDETDFILVERLLRKRLNRDKSSYLPRSTKAVVIDFDGVLTDNGVWVSSEGTESVRCHRGDGWAIQRLKELGIQVVVLTNERNPVVRHRCEKLQVECISVQGPKLPILTQWIHRNQLDPDSIVYVGNDEPDVPSMMHVGCGVAPLDAFPPAQRAAQLILDTPGGHGCIRELAQLIMDNQGGLV